MLLSISQINPCKSTFADLIIRLAIGICKFRTLADKSSSLAEAIDSRVLYPASKSCLALVNLTESSSNSTIKSTEEQLYWSRLMNSFRRLL